MDKSRWGVHENHCCVIHGCKYRDEDCPVESGLTRQLYICEWCDNDGIQTLEQVIGMDKLKNDIKEAIDTGKKELLVDVDLLEFLVNR